MTDTPLSTAAAVPAQHRGRARIWRQKAIAPAGHADVLYRQINATLQPRGNFTPVPRHAVLRSFAAAWAGLPDFGRLSHLEEFEGGRLRLAEIRAVPCKMRFETWEGDPEHGIAVGLALFICAPPQKLKVERRLLADCRGTQPWALFPTRCR